MQHRNLGRSGLAVSALSFGTWTFGEKASGLKVGSTGLAQARRQIDLCLEAGINLFDTADRYGDSEQILGEALRGRRHDVLVATKAGLPMGTGENAGGSSRGYLIRAVEASLKRLGTDYIDLFQLHGWDGRTPLDETMNALDSLVRAGKIRYVGTCNFSAWHLMKCLAICRELNFIAPISQQIHYTLASREAENELLPVAIDQGLGAIVWSPLAGGILSGKYRGGRPAPVGTRAGDNKAGSGGADRGLPGAERDNLDTILDALGQIAQERGASSAQVALAWLLGRAGVSSILVGARTEDQLLDNIQAARLDLTPEERSHLDAASLRPPLYPYWHQASKIQGRLSAADLVALAPHIDARPTSS